MDVSNEEYFPPKYIKHEGKKFNFGNFRVLNKYFPKEWSKIIKTLKCASGKILACFLIDQVWVRFNFGVRFKREVKIQSKFST